MGQLVVRMDGCCSIRLVFDSRRRCGLGQCSGVLSVWLGARIVSERPEAGRGILAPLEGRGPVVFRLALARSPTPGPISASDGVGGRAKGGTAVPCGNPNVARSGGRIGHFAVVGHQRAAVSTAGIAGQGGALPSADGHCARGHCSSQGRGDPRCEFPVPGHDGGGISRGDHRRPHRSTGVAANGQPRTH